MENISIEDIVRKLKDLNTKGKTNNIILLYDDGSGTIITENNIDTNSYGKSFLISREVRYSPLNILDSMINEIEKTEKHSELTKKLENLCADYEVSTEELITFLKNRKVDMK